MTDKHIHMFLLISILFVSQGTVSPQYQIHNEDIKNSKKDCSKNEVICSTEEMQDQILSTMVDFANTEVDKVQNIITDLIKLLKLTTSTQLESSSNTIDKITAAVFTAIILNRTQNPGNCFDGKEEQLTALSTKIITNRNECVTVYHNTGLDWLLNANITISEILSNFKNVPVMLSNCLFDSDNVCCLRELLQTINKWSANLPKTISSISKNAEKMAADVTGNVTNCVRISVATCSVEIINFVLEISECVYMSALTSTKTNSQKTCFGFFDNVVNNMLSITNNTLSISNAVKVLSQQISFVNDIKKQQLANGISSISKLFDDQITFINSIKDENNSRSDFIQCLTNLTNEATSVLNHFSDILNKCQTAIIQSIQALIKTQIEKLENIMDNINSNIIKLIGCFFSLPCIAQVSDKIAGEFVIANDVLNFIPNVMNGVLTVSKSLEDCNKAVVASAVNYTSHLTSLAVTNCWNTTTIL